MRAVTPGRTVPALLAALVALPAACTSPRGGAGGVESAPSSTPSVPAFRPEALLTRAELERHLGYLASDQLAGRATGEPGARLAALHLARELRDAGCRPAFQTDRAAVPAELEPGLEGYLQPVPIERVVYDEAPALRLALRPGGAPKELDPGVDFQGVSGLLPAGSFDLVRLSSGLEASRVGPNTALLLDGDAAEREAWLMAAGEPALVLLAGSKRPGAGRAGPPRARPRLVREGRVREPPSLTLRGPALELARSGEVSRVLVDRTGRRERLEAWNVVGTLPGSGPRAGEAVVLSAHYDHIGTRAPRPGEAADADLIMNGADDDASGCAFVALLARALAAGPAPERTVVCLFAAAEELGLLGTEHYLDHPAVPLEDTVLNLNFEMVGRPDALVGAGVLWLTGDERTNLGLELRAAGVGVVPDPRPEQRFFSRSDNYAFARRGVVAQTLSSYDLHGDYHQPSDELERLDFEHMARALWLAWCATERVTAGALDPAWNPGGRP